MTRVVEAELQFVAVPAAGPGGQHVNRSLTAVQLRFDIRASSLPERIKQRLLGSGDRRINSDGVLVLLAQEHRSQQRNREAARLRLEEIVARAAKQSKPRRPTRATRASKEKRLQKKQQRGRTKTLRGRVTSKDD